MNRVSNRNEGYTIIETLIFLAVTAALFASSISVVSGQQARTEFQQAVRDIQTQLQDIANDVSTGYYQKNESLRCQQTAGKPQLIPAGSIQGSNEECIFLGRAVQFAPTPSTGAEKLNVYNVVGLRKSTVTGKEVQTYSEAVPTAMASGTTTNPSTPNDAVQTINLQAGVKVAYVRFVHNGVPTSTSGFGFISTLAQYSSLGTIASGSLSLDIIPIGAPMEPPGKPAGDFVDDINNLNLVALQKNPNGGIVFCINSDGDKQNAVFSFGIDRKLTPLVVISQGPC